MLYADNNAYLISDYSFLAPIYENNNRERPFEWWLFTFQKPILKHIYFSYLRPDPKDLSYITSANPSLLYLIGRKTIEVDYELFNSLDLSSFKGIDGDFQMTAAPDIYHDFDWKNKMVFERMNAKPRSAPQNNIPEQEEELDILNLITSCKDDFTKTAQQTEDNRDSAPQNQEQTIAEPSEPMWTGVIRFTRGGI